MGEVTGVSPTEVVAPKEAEKVVLNRVDVWEQGVDTYKGRHVEFTFDDNKLQKREAAATTETERRALLQQFSVDALKAKVKEIDALALQVEDAKNEPTVDENKVALLEEHLELALQDMQAKITLPRPQTVAEQAPMVAEAKERFGKISDKMTFVWEDSGPEVSEQSVAASTSSVGETPTAVGIPENTDSVKPLQEAVPNKPSTTEVQIGNNQAITSGVGEIVQGAREVELELRLASGDKEKVRLQFTIDAELNPDGFFTAALAVSGNQEIAKRSYYAKLDDGTTNLVLYSGLHVDPSHERIGIGRALVEADTLIHEQVLAAYKQKFPDHVISQVQVKYYDSTEGKDFGWTRRRMDAMGIKKDDSGAFTISTEQPTETKPSQT